VSAALALFTREMRLAFAGGGGPAGPAAFNLAALSLAPLAIGPDAGVLAAAGPGLICFAALLATLQPAERLYGEDASDGTLELYALSGQSLALTCLVKALAFTCAVFWPLPILAFLGALAYGLAPGPALVTGFALLLAAPGLALVASFAGALAAGLKRAGLLIALIAAPLQAPLLIFAAGAARSSVEAAHLVGPNLMMTAAYSLAALALAPFGAAAALRARLE